MGVPILHKTSEITVKGELREKNSISVHTHTLADILL